ncbi:MAG: hypothetical protein ACRD4E_07415 [Bryobacteraceae bacterium]
MAILPHTHYLDKKLEGWAVFPGGARQELLRIPDWDFNWKCDYRYAHPVHLPAGALLRMRYLRRVLVLNPADQLARESLQELLDGKAASKH